MIQKDSPQPGLTKSTRLRLLVTLVAIAGFTAIGPPEKTLGANARLVYLHGVWVWTALAAFMAAGMAGVWGLITHREALQRWSRSLGRTGLIFWITYLPISLWAMETNWNGLFLAEPRWRLAVIFAIGGLLLQAGLSLVDRPAWASAANLVYLLVLLLALQTTENVMHPPGPILHSEAQRIQLHFAVLLGLTLAAGWQIARWWQHFESPGVQTRSH